MRGVEHIPWLYDSLMLFTEWTGLRRWRRWLAGDARGRVLDLGTGTGLNLPHYEGSRHPVALDPCHSCLGRARRRRPGAMVVRARAEALPFRDGAFDTVVSALVFCSVDDPQEALAEVRRVLAPGGRLRMMEHVRSTRRSQAALQDWIEPAWRVFTGGCRPNRETEAELVRAGFAMEPEGRRVSGVMRRFQARPLPRPES